MSVQLVITFRIDSRFGSDTHLLGNIADDIWKVVLLLKRTHVVDGLANCEMRIVLGRPLRKKERDELERRIKALSKDEPGLDPQVRY